MKPSIENIEFHGLAALRLNGPGGSSATISLFGGQVLSWVTPDGREHLFLSERAVFDGSVAIRGGIPVCWPQFGRQGGLPAHGLVRTRSWSVGAQRCDDDYALATLEIADDAETRTLWPHPFRLELTVMLERDRLDLELGVVNPGGAELSFTGALHTYLRVTQVEDVALEGLHGHLNEALVACGFLDPARPGRLDERMRRLASRAGLEREEVDLLRGMISALSGSRGGKPTQ
jgi:glucose-6-phosphate 1-epimerase